MSQNSDPENHAPLRPLTIREAAGRLGVSERTVYRRLRSGKLRATNLSEIEVSDVSMTVVTSRQISPKEASQNCHSESICDKMSDDTVTTSAMEALRAEIRAKDAQIAKMLEVQHEMAQTVQRLQEQMFELARLVLTQNAAKTAAVGGDATSPANPASTKQKSLFTRLFGTSDKESKDQI